MKIYEIGTGYTPIPAQISAATEIVVEELTKALLKQGIDVQIVDIASNSRAQTDLPIRQVRVPGIFADTDVQLGIMHKMKRVVYSIALAWKLKKILKQENGRPVLHFHNQYNLFFFFKLVPEHLRHKCLIAYTNHSGVWRLPWDTIKDTIRKRYFQEAECMKRADIVFLLNQETKRNVIEHLKVPEDRLIVLGNGVNTEIYRPLPAQEKELIRVRYGLSGKRVILQVGSVYENKGQLRSVEYMMPLMKKYPDLVYAYAGGIVDQDYQERVLAYAADHGMEERIRYLGMLSPGEGLNELYNMAEATILPSTYEAFGMVVTESCAAGTPVLVDSRGPVRIGKGTISYDRNAFLDTVEPLLENGTAEFCTLARENACSNYSWHKVAGDYLTAFDNRLSAF